METHEKAELQKLGIKLRKFRLAKNYSQEQFAELAELDRTYVSCLERGLKNPSFLILQKLIKVLEISSTELF